MGLIGYNLFNIFLNFHDCKDFKTYSLNTWRQRIKSDPNPNVLIYTGNTYAIMRTLDLILLLIDLLKRVQDIIKPEIERIKKEQDGPINCPNDQPLPKKAD